MSEEKCLTLSVPEAGRIYFGLKPQGAYAAAARGALPVIKLGRRLRVPVAALDALLETAGKKREAAE
jgi:hypothetical protein